MSPVSKQIVDLVDMLPEQDQQLAYELVKKLVLAWDPDFTKLTAAEAEQLQQSEFDIANGNAVNFNDIDWD